MAYFTCKNEDDYRITLNVINIVKIDAGDLIMVAMSVHRLGYLGDKLPGRIEVLKLMVKEGRVQIYSDLAIDGYAREFGSEFSYDLKECALEAIEVYPL